ncbi:microtubule-associated protein Gb4, putative, partial [Trypanosoma cruzi marinkellei]
MRPQIKEAVAQDIACRLEVPRTNITTDEYYGDSLIVQTAVEHDGTRTDAQLQQSIATCVFPTVTGLLKEHHRSKQFEKGLESHSQAKPCKKATLGPEPEAESVLAPPTKEKQASTGPTLEPQKLYDLEQYDMKETIEMTPTESARSYLRNRLNSPNDTMRRLEKEDGAQMSMALRRLEANTNNRNRDTKIQHHGNIYEWTPNTTDQTRTANTVKETPPQITKQERQATTNKVTDKDLSEPPEDAEKKALAAVLMTRELAEGLGKKALPPQQRREHVASMRNERGMISAVEEKAK